MWLQPVIFSMGIPHYGHRIPQVPSCMSPHWLHTFYWHLCLGNSSLHSLYINIQYTAHITTRLCYDWMYSANNSGHSNYTYYSPYTLEHWGHVILCAPVVILSLTYSSKQFLHYIESYLQNLCWQVPPCIKVTLSKQMEQFIIYKLITS